MPRANDETMLSDINTIFEKWAPAVGDMKTDLPATSEIFVRELVQNFMDAGDDLAAPEGMPELTFRFVNLQEESLKSLEADLMLSQLIERWSSFKSEPRNQVSKMRTSDFLEGVTANLRLLVVTEENTSGMYGPWDRTDQVRDSRGREIFNKMRDALLANARDAASNQAGRGSFGEGKKAIIGISKARTLLAYSAFDPETTEDDTYSRLIGVSYWPNHIIHDRKHTGLGVFGNGEGLQESEIPYPFRNQEAEELVSRLGIPGLNARGSGATSKRGTSYVFVDPMITPEECLEALVRNWWPAIDRKVASFAVFDGDEELSLDEELKKHTELAPFRELLDQRASIEVANDSWNLANSPAVQVSSPKMDTCKSQIAGDLKVSIDLRPGKGFSQRDPDKNRSIICYVRDHMVICYTSHYRDNAKDHPPFVRGVFEVNARQHPISQMHLRNSEPAVHNSWQIEADKVGHDAAKHARAVRDEIRKAVNNFKANYEKTMPATEVDLPIFREVLSVKASSGLIVPPPPPPPKSPLSLLDVRAFVEDVGGGLRVAKAVRSLQTSATAVLLEYPVQVSLSWEILGDKGLWTEWISPTETKITSIPEGFSMDEVTGLISGIVTKEALKFEFESKAYSDLFTVRPLMRIIQVSENDAESATTGGDDIGS